MTERWLGNDMTLLVEDDDAAQVSYHPPTAWDKGDTSFAPRFHGRSYHVTHRAGAYVEFVFNGSYVAYYSDSNANHGAFAASIDDGPASTHTSYAPTWQSPSQLFEAEVEAGAHTLRIANTGDAAGGRDWMGVDYFVYRPLPTSDSPTKSPAPTSSPSHKSRVNAAEIVAPIVSILALLLLAAMAIALKRRRRRRREKRDVLQPLAVPSPPPYSEESISAAGVDSEKRFVGGKALLG